MRTRIVAIACAAGLACAAWARAADSAPATAPATAPADARLVLLHVNDVHGQTQPHEQDGQSVGGYARLASLVKRARAEANDAVLIHAGDELSRGDALTRRTLGAANVELMNALGFDMWTPGNGEFYDGVDNLQALGRKAKFPLLTANVKLAASGKRLGQPFVVRQVGPVKVAFFGLCHVTSDSQEDLTVDDPIRTAAAVVPELRKQADVVVAVTHIGFLQDLRLAATVPGIDVILGGHTHTLLAAGHPVKGPDGRAVLICQAGEHLTHLGRVDLDLRRGKDGRFELVQSRARVIPINSEVPEDEAVKKLLARLSAQAPSRPADMMPGR